MNDLLLDWEIISSWDGSPIRGFFRDGSGEIIREMTPAEMDEHLHR